MSDGAMEEMIRGVLRDVYPWPSVATGCTGYSERSGSMLLF